MSLPPQILRLGVPDDGVVLQHGDVLFLRWDAFQQCFRAFVGSNIPPSGPVALTDAAHVVADGSRGNVFVLTFTGAIGNTRAMGRPVGLFDLQEYDFKFVQDATGGRSINQWDPIFVWPGGTPPTFNSAANSFERWVFKYDAHADKLNYLAHEVD